MIRPIDMDFWDRVSFSAMPAAILVYIRMSRYLGKPIFWPLIIAALFVWIPLLVIVVLQLLGRIA